MNRFLQAASAILFALAGTQASAADLKGASLLPPAPELPSFYDWSGIYLGVQGGYSWGRDRLRTASALAPGFATALSFDSESGFGGAQAGFNYQSGAIVFGVEADVEALDASRGWIGANGSGRIARDWQGSVRARLGYAMDRILVYGTGGAAFTEFDYRFVGTGGLTDVSTQSRTGWNVGAGVNYAFDRVVVGTEYRYTDFGRMNRAGGIAFPGQVTEQETRAHSLRASVAYKF